MYIYECPIRIHTYICMEQLNVFDLALSLGQLLVPLG